MTSRPRPRKPLPATVIACVALFFSLTTAGLAAQHYLITSLSQIKPNVRQALRGAPGPQGPAGIQGPAGSAAAVQPLIATTYAYSPVATITPGGIGGATATCPLGTRAVSGGWQAVPGTRPDLFVIDTNITADGDGWSVLATIPSTTSPSARFWVIVVCSS